MFSGICTSTCIFCDFTYLDAPFSVRIPLPSGMEPASKDGAIEQTANQPMDIIG